MPAHTPKEPAHKATAAQTGKRADSLIPTTFKKSGVKGKKIK